MREWIGYGANRYLVPLNALRAVGLEMVDSLTEDDVFANATARSRKHVLERASRSLHINHRGERANGQISQWRKVRKLAGGRYRPKPSVCRKTR